MTADFVDGKEAERIGLVSLCVPRAQLLDKAMATADKLANGSQLAICYTVAVAEQLDADVSAGLRCFARDGDAVLPR
ncbi:hypothetical protein JQ604_19050 [Bradyrhizobium jicamae]|nr:hypothetical protein [Bradyrhizobium jicamae]